MIKIVTGALVLALAAIALPVSVVADGATTADPKCKCRFQGQRFNVGDYVCIRSQLARCDMFLNNTTWTFLDDSCGSVKLEPLPQSRPAHTLAALSNGG